MTNSSCLYTLGWRFTGGFGGGGFFFAAAAAAAEAREACVGRALLEEEERTREAVGERDCAVLVVERMVVDDGERGK